MVWVFSGLGLTWFGCSVVWVLRGLGLTWFGRSVVGCSVVGRSVVGRSVGDPFEAIFRQSNLIFRF